MDYKYIYIYVYIFYLITNSLKDIKDNLQIFLFIFISETTGSKILNIYILGKLKILHQYSENLQFVCKLK